jgi:hypothetical protein
MTDVGNNMSPSGPPARLFTHSERVRRRRAVALSVVIIGSFAIFLTWFTLHSATNPESDAHLGSDTFRVGGAKSLKARIEADGFPLLFQDLRNNSIDIYVDHQKGKPFYEGWRAFEAHAPGASRRCQLEWTGREYKDPCTDETYPANGQGLRRYEAKVVKGFVVVDLRKRVSTSSGLTD